MVLDGSVVLADAGPLHLLGSGAVDQEGGRLAVGLTVALLLAVAATWLLRTTEWGAVGLPSTTDE